MAMFVLYIVARWSRVSRVPKHVFWIVIAMALGIPGGWGSGSPDDLWGPLSMSLAAVSVMGIFVAEFHHEEDLRLIAIVAVLALPFACYISIVRNGLDEQWTTGSRYGINLMGYFLNFACVYAMTMRTPYIFLSIFPMLLLTGSRTSAAATVITLLLYPRFTQLLAKKWLQIVLVIGILLTIGGFIFARQKNESFHNLMTPYSESMHHEERYTLDNIQASIMTRFSIAGGWFSYAIRHPTLFGHGIKTYSLVNEEENIDFPHNGILHVFNGLGIPAGIIYTVILLLVVKLYFEKRKTLSDQFSWAGAFFIGICSRMFTEAQLVVALNHISGFLLCYGCGLAVFGLTSAASKPSAHKAQFQRKRRTSYRK